MGIISCRDKLEIRGAITKHSYIASPTPYLFLLLGAADIREPSKNTSGTKTASDTQEYTVGNLTRMGVAGLILVALGMLLFEAWHSQRRTTVQPGREHRDTPPSR